MPSTTRLARFRVLRAAIAAAALTLAAGACRGILSPERAVTLRVLRLAAPDTVPAAGPLTVAVTVVVGGCVRFEGLDATRPGPGRLELVARGRDGERPGISCPQDIREERHEYRARPSFTDPFAIVARQPDGSAVERLVRVR